MKGSLSKRYWSIMAILVLSAGLSAAVLYPGKGAPQANYAKNLPMDFAGWSGRDLPVSDIEIRILETEDILSREYSRVNEPLIFLAVVYAQENRKVAHPPEICLAGGGWEVEGKKTVEIGDGFPVVRLTTAHGLNREVFYYFYKSGDDLTESYLKQQITSALSIFSGAKASAALIRVSTYVRGGDVEAADRRLEEFTLKLLPQVKKVLP
jgi:EpsI family protein